MSTTIDHSGTWTWVIQSRQGRPDRLVTLNVKATGEKATGEISSTGADGQKYSLKIDQGMLKGDAISFSTTREVNGVKMTTKYSGTIKFSGSAGADIITGKMDFERDGEPMSRDWVATRSK